MKFSRKVSISSVWFRPANDRFFDIHAFLMDTGPSTGEILGHSKVSSSDAFIVGLFFFHPVSVYVIKRLVVV